MGKYFCINGLIVSSEKAMVPVTDQGFLYGYGLFETMLVLGGRPVFWAEHLTRLEQSMKELDLQPVDPHSITTMLYDTIAANNLINGSLRLTVTAGALTGDATGEEVGQNVVITVRAGKPYSAELYREGFKAGILQARRNEKSPLVRLKTLNYLENILGRREAARRGWNEGLFLNSAGFLCEGTISNLFLVTGGKLLTPHVDSGLLAGIVRKTVVNLANDKGVPVRQCFLLPEELMRAEEAFLTNSLLGIMPLVTLNGQRIGGGSPGYLTQELMKEYDRLLESYLE